MSPARRAAGWRQPAWRENKVVAEGAGAIPVAAALANRHRFRSVCAVVSGGNLDPALLAKILRGEDPKVSH